MQVCGERGQNSIGDAAAPIAVIGFPGLGDLVRCHSLIQMIAEQNPGRPIDIVTPRLLAEIAEFMREVREVISADLQHRRLNPFARLALSNTLRERHYGTVYIIQSSFKAALVPFLARIPERIGWAQECRLPLLTKPRFGMRRLSRMVDRICWLGVEDEQKMPTTWPEPKLRVPATLQNEFEALAEKARAMAPVVAICTRLRLIPIKTGRLRIMRQLRAIASRPAAPSGSSGLPTIAIWRRQSWNALRRVII